MIHQIHKPHNSYRISHNKSSNINNIAHTFLLRNKSSNSSQIFNINNMKIKTRITLLLNLLLTNFSKVFLILVMNFFVSKVFIYRNNTTSLRNNIISICCPYNSSSLKSKVLEIRFYKISRKPIHSFWVM